MVYVWKMYVRVYMHECGSQSKVLGVFCQPYCTALRKRASLRAEPTELAKLALPEALRTHLYLCSSPGHRQRKPWPAFHVCELGSSSP